MAEQTQFESTIVEQEGANIKMDEEKFLMVYVAGPLTNKMDNTDEDYVSGNINEAIKVAHWLAEHGFVPYVPHLTWYWHKQYPDTPYELWLTMCKEFIRRCDALFRIDGISFGADREVEIAQSIGIPVFTVLSQVLEWRAMERRADH
jgi:hypothetical protein